MTSILGRQLVQAMPPPAPDFRWRVFMPPLPTGLLNGILGKSGGNISQVTTFPYFSPSNPAYDSSGGVFVEGISWPFRQVQASNRFGGAKSWYYPGFYDTPSFNITFYEDDQLSATQYLRLWRMLVIHPNGNYGIPVEYKQYIYLNMYNWYDDRNPIFQGTIFGCWPTAQNSFDLSYSNDGRLTVSCAFSCDDNPDDPNA